MCRVAYGVATGAIVASICYTAYKAVRLNLSMNVLDTPEYLAYEVTCTQPRRLEGEQHRPAPSQSSPLVQLRIISKGYVA